MTQSTQFTNVDEAIEFLSANLQPSNPTAAYPDAAQYLGRSGDGRALDPLVQALNEGNSYIRATAALGLGELGRREGVPYLMEAFLHDPGLYVRCDAALALGKLGSEESLSVFLERFLSEEFEVQKRIVLAISQIGSEKARGALRSISSLLETLDASQGEKEFLTYLVSQGLNEIRD